MPKPIEIDIEIGNRIEMLEFLDEYRKSPNTSPDEIRKREQEYALCLHVWDSTTAHILFELVDKAIESGYILPYGESVKDKLNAKLHKIFTLARTRDKAIAKMVTDGNHSPTEINILATKNPDPIGIINKHIEKYGYKLEDNPSYISTVYIKNKVFVINGLDDEKKAHLLEVVTNALEKLSGKLLGEKDEV